MNRDYVCRLPTLPRPGETLLGGALTVGSGGKGGNQAVAAALVDARVAMVGCVGRDDDGDALVADLTRVGVNTQHVGRVDVARTGAAFVFVDDHGENSIVVAPGANARLEADAVTGAVTDLVGAAGVVVAQAEIPAAAMLAALHTAAALGARPVLNLAPFRAVPADTLSLCDPLVVNQSEVESLVGRPVHDTDEALEAAHAVLEIVASAVITLGAEGAVVAHRDLVTHVPARPARVVDSTGAGDAFTGVLVAGLSRGDDLVTATRRGVAAGTFAVARPGAQASYPRAADLDHPDADRTHPGTDALRR
jgi:ribokinase